MTWSTCSTISVYWGYFSISLGSTLFLTCDCRYTDHQFSSQEIHTIQRQLDLSIKLENCTAFKVAKTMHTH